MSSRALRRPLAFSLLVLVMLSLSGTPLAATQARAEGSTSSAKTVRAADYDPDATNSPFPDLAVTVSQTEDLAQQGITVSWTGGQKSETPQGTVGGSNFLQIMQCWGSEPGSDGTRPDRRTCQYGGTGSWGATRDGNTMPEAVAPQDAKYSADLGGYNYVGIPFVAYNSANIVDESKAPADKVLTNTTTNDAGQVVLKSPMIRFDTNEYFTSLTTNEVKWAPSGNDGSGSAPFELQTAMQSPGLGCGSPATISGVSTGQSCWLVIIPRGLGDNGSSLINTPGLWWSSWAHHLAVKLDFRPLGVACELGAAERQLAGSELVAEAIASWQPVVCQGGSPFTLAQVPETDALAAAAGTTPSALAFTSRPLDRERNGLEKDPLAYAPVALGGIAISFAIDAFPDSSAGEQYRNRAGLPLTDMKLTPRLLAKLLTASYVDALPSGADLSHIGYKSFTDPGNNARSLVFDPDFRAINDPEWSVQLIVGASISDVLMPLGRSDLAERVWEYVLADAEARAWLAGEPDPWGMVVNPCYSTNAEVSAKCPKLDTSAPDTAPLSLPRDDFPKADPSEKVDTTLTDPANGTGALNLVTWRPYASGFVDGGYRVLRGDGMTLGAWDKFSVPPKFGKSQRQLLGSRQVLALTSTPAARLYQTATAQLRNPAGKFVSPTSASLTAAAAAMTPVNGQKQVLSFDQSSAKAKAAKDAYPLAIPVYAALNPQQTDADQRSDYAKLISYAAGDGQSPGSEDGELPSGYAPLPSEWRTQAKAAAEVIRTGIWPAVTPTPTPTPSPSPSSTTATSAPQPSAVPSATPDQDPSATGEPSGVLTGPVTPADPGLGALSAVVPATGVAGLAAAVGIPLISRRRRLP